MKIVAVEETNKPIFVGIHNIIIGGLYLVFTIPIGLFAIAWSGVDNSLFQTVVMIIALLCIEAFVVMSGIYSVKRKKWGLALAGSIIAIVGFPFTGIFAIILVVRSRYEFDKMNRDFVKISPYGEQQE